MSLRRRDVLLLAAVGLTAAAAGVLLGPRLLVRGGSARALHSATFKDLAGSPRSLAEWSGRVLLVNFWASWCAPCREEMPLLSELRDRYAPSGFEAVGIAVDSAMKVLEFLANTPVTYPILLAEAGGLDLMRELGNGPGGLPFTVLLDRKGEIAWKKLGILKREELETQIRSALG